MAVINWDLLMILPRDTGIARDAVVNTYHLCTNTATFDHATQHATVSGYFSTFYLAMADSYAASYGSNNVAHMKWYRADDPKPRVPVYDDPVTFLNTTGDDGPHEVALCLSWKAVVPSGVHAARRRGRVYLGPFRGLETGYERPQTSLVTKVKNAGSALLQSVRTITGEVPQTGLAIRSVKDGVYEPISGLWVDNEWDTQRRRGQRASTRQTYNLP